MLSDARQEFRKGRGRTIYDPYDFIKVSTDSSGVLDHGADDLLGVDDEDCTDLRGDEGQSM